MMDPWVAIAISTILLFIGDNDDKNNSPTKRRDQDGTAQLDHPIGTDTFIAEEEEQLIKTLLAEEAEIAEDRLPNKSNNTGPSIASSLFSTISANFSSSFPPSSFFPFSSASFLSSPSSTPFPPLPSFPTSSSPSADPLPEPLAVERLPDWVNPIEYQLGLSLDSELDFLRGQVQIQLQCRRPTSLLLLHLSPDFVSVHHLIVHSKLLNRTVPVRHTELDWRHQMIRIGLDEELALGHVYYLEIWFSARYADDGRGLSRQWERDSWWLNSLFEPSFARRLLPCFDEPRFRSAFRLELWLWNQWASEHFVALSSTQSVCRRWHSSLTMCSFAATPPIPSYLFTLGLGRFRSVCNQSELPLLESDICVWRLASMIEQDDQWEGRALQVIDSMAEFQAGMSDYLLADPGARLHVLVVPMKINGMENFGLLNVRETLWPAPNESSRGMQRFEKTLFHEMTHQWFGNLVTPSWWDSIWLSESATTFLSSARPIVFDPTSDLSESALVNDSWAVHSGGGGPRARPGGTIPRILYTKGAVLLEMLDSIIGPRRMQRVFRDLVRKFQYGTADTSDFLAILGQIMDMDTRTNGQNESRDHNGESQSHLAVLFLDRWLHQPSHPIVFVDFDPELGQICLSQAPKMSSSPVPQRWPIPIWIECLEGTVPERLYWMPEGDNNAHQQLIIPLHELTLSNSTRSLAFNRNRTVYYQMLIRIRP